jgi:hypothetical protein
VNGGRSTVDGESASAAKLKCLAAAPCPPENSHRGEVRAPVCGYSWASCRSTAVVFEYSCTQAKPAGGSLTWAYVRRRRHGPVYEYSAVQVHAPFHRPSENPLEEMVCIFSVAT